MTLEEITRDSYQQNELPKKFEQLNQPKGEQKCFYTKSPSDTEIY